MFDDLLNDIEKDISGDWNLIKDRIKDERNNKKYKCYFKLLDGIIDLNRSNRNKKLKNTIGLIPYSVEYCTIKFDIGRQTGKTEYIIRNTKKDDIIIVLHSRMLYNVIEKVDCNVITIQEVIDKHIPLGPFNNIWVDNYSYLSQYQDIMNYIRDKIYNIFIDRRVEQTFIFLG